MCSCQSPGARAGGKATQGTYIKQGEPGSHTSWTRAQRSLPSPPGEQAHSTVSTAAPYPAGTPLRSWKGQPRGWEGPERRGQRCLVAQSSRDWPQLPSRAWLLSSIPCLPVMSWMLEPDALLCAGAQFSVANVPSFHWVLEGGHDPPKG